MADKTTILKSVLPLAVLEALTLQAIEAVPPDLLINNMILIRRFPFRIGRESRVKEVKGKLVRVERPKLDNREPNNDLYLLDHGTLLNISREHLLIDLVDGRQVLVDRGSACGTKLNQAPVGGGDQGGVSELSDGDIITIGTKDSPYRYRYIDLSSYCISETA